MAYELYCWTHTTADSLPDVISPLIKRTIFYPVNISSVFRLANTTTHPSSSKVSRACFYRVFAFPFWHFFPHLLETYYIWDALEFHTLYGFLILGPQVWPGHSSVVVSAGRAQTNFTEPCKRQLCWPSASVGVVITLTEQKPISCYEVSSFTRWRNEHLALRYNSVSKLVLLRAATDGD